MIVHSREQGWKREFGIHYHRNSLPTPFGSSWCRVEVGGATAPHDHREGETFFILEGNGLMEIEGRAEMVQPNDIVLIPPGSRHVLRNTGPRPLKFLSVWWDVPAPQKAFVAIAPPTPNGDLHLGHLSGPYLAADSYCRFLQMQGAETVLISGSDDHQSYVARQAKLSGRAPEEVAASFAVSIEATLRKAGVQLDAFLRPRQDESYRAYVQSFFLDLVESDALVLRETEVLRCDSCARELFEAYVSGGCPHCGEHTNGQGCENCGLPNEPRNLSDPHCNDCGAPARRELGERFFFAIPELTDYHARTTMSPRLRRFAERARTVTEVSATFAADWGIPVPIAGYENQVIYEWIEAAASYEYLAKQNHATGHDFVQFFGFDNSFFYTTLVPALLLAHGRLAPPRSFVSNEFLRLDGRKFSTSRRHAIWAPEILARVPAEALRFHLARCRPEREQTNFTLAGFRAQLRELQAIERWLAAVDAKLEAGGRQTPGPNGPPPVQVEQLLEDIAESYRAESFSLNRASTLLLELATLGAAGHELTTELVLVKAFALAAYPLLPELSARLRQALGETDQPRWSERLTPLPAGRIIGRLNIDLFTRAENAL